MKIDHIDLQGLSLADVNDRITSLANITAKTNLANTFTANQNIQGQLVLSGTDNFLKVNKSNASWLGWYLDNGSSRRAYFGFPGSNHDMEWKNENANANISLTTTGDNSRININCGSGAINLNGTTNIGGNTNFGRNEVKFGTVIKMGIGGSPIIQPDDNSNKVLQFLRFEINMNAKKITNLGAPTAVNDAATKAYVDSIKISLKGEFKAKVREATDFNHLKQLIEQWT